MIMESLLFNALHSLSFMAELDIVPLGEYFSEPWDWFLKLGTITKWIVVIFGAIGFYVILRLFYMMVEAFVSMFQ